MGTTEDGWEWEAGGHGGRRSDPHPLQAPIQRVVDGKPRPREGMALKQSYEDVLHALLHLTPSNYELQDRPPAYFSAPSEPNTELGRCSEC